jgi:sugar/nucleoside kinase (ribokinase family)
MLAAVGASRCLIIEGYLWELPNAEETITQAVSEAKKQGTTVVMTTADVSVVSKFRDNMLATLSSVDMLFTNAAEAQALVGQGLECLSRWDTSATQNSSSGADMQELLSAARVCERWGGHSSSLSSTNRDHMEAEMLGAQCMSLRVGSGRHRSKIHDAGDAALQLGRLCSTAVVTDGSKGSCVAALGQLHVIPPYWTQQAPVDTCGAGDAYAAGFLYGYLSGRTIHEMGELAAEAASAVISHEGPQLRQQDAERLAAKWAQRQPTPLVDSIPSGVEAHQEGSSLWPHSSALRPSVQCF